MAYNHGQVYWTELNTWEPDKAAAFAEKTLGWKIDSMPMAQGGTYLVGIVGGAPAGGIFGLSTPEFDKSMPSHWLTYFAVDDVEASLAAVRANGGKVMRDVFEVPGVGRIAIIQEPTGAVCGYMTPSETPA